MSCPVLLLNTYNGVQGILWHLWYTDKDCRKKTPYKRFTGATAEKKNDMEQNKCEGICGKCPYGDNPRKFIPEAVSYDPQSILVLWESPNWESDQAYAFSQRTADYKMFMSTVRKRSKSGIANRMTHDFAVRCFTNKTPAASVINLCRTYTLDLLEEMRPEAVIVVGNAAMRAVTKQTGITKKCHSTLKIALEDGTEIPVIPVLSPAYVLRDRNQQGRFEATIDYAVSVLEGRAVTVEDVWKKANINIAPTSATLKEFYRRAVKGDLVVAVDTETTTLHPWVGTDWRVLSIGVSDGEETLVLPYDFPGEETAKRRQQLTPEQALLLAILRNEKIRKVAHNAKYDMHVIGRRFGVHLAGVVADTLVMHRVLFPMVGGHTLKTIASEMLRVPEYTQELKAYIGEGTNSLRYAKVPYPTLAKYNGMDCYVCVKSYEAMRKKLIKTSMSRKGVGCAELPVAGTLVEAYKNVVQPAFAPLYEMEVNGFYVRKAYAKTVEETLDREQDRCLELCASDPVVQRVYKEKRDDEYEILLRKKNNAILSSAECRKVEAIVFNPNSGKQVAEVVFGNTGYNEQVDHLTAGGDPSTSEEALEAVIRRGSQASDLCRAVLSYRSAGKHRGTFVTGLLDLVADDSRVHTTFHLFGTATGRGSSSDPNLQNIPRDKTYRGLYGCEPGRLLVEADYSQLELRLLAAYSGDPNMVAVYEQGRDLHMETAMAVAGTNDPSMVEKEMRTAAKSVNFGIAYGLTSYGLSAQLTAILGRDVTGDEAQYFIDKFNSLYPGVVDWQVGARLFAQQNGWVSTMFGTHRDLLNAQITPKTHEERMLKEEALRNAINTPVQGTGGLCTMVALAHLRRRWKGTANKIVSYVHDSIIADIPGGNLRNAILDMKDCMSNAPMAYIGRFMRGLKLPVDIKIGRNWGEMMELGKAKKQ